MLINIQNTKKKKKGIFILEERWRRKQRRYRVDCEESKVAIVEEFWVLLLREVVVLFRVSRLLDSELRCGGVFQVRLFFVSLW